MVNILAPITKTPTYVKVANFPGLYRHSRSGRYYGCKKLGGIRRERSLGTCDRKIAERRLKEWIGNLDKVDAEVEKTTLGQLIGRFLKVTSSTSKSSRTTDQSIIKRFLAWWPHGKDFQVRLIRPSMLDEWLAHEEPRLRNVTYNRYAGFLKQLFDIAVKDRIIPESPAKLLRQGWKKLQAVRRQVPSMAQFEAIVADIRSQRRPALTPRSPLNSWSSLGWQDLGRPKRRRSPGPTWTGRTTVSTFVVTRQTRTSTCPLILLQKRGRGFGCFLEG